MFFILSTLVNRMLFSSFQVILAIILHPWFLLKVATLWFCVALAITYSYFLWTHQEAMVHMRSTLIRELAIGLWLGFISALAVIGIYEFMLQMMCYSVLFAQSQGTLCAISLMAQGPQVLQQAVAYALIILSSFFICHRIEPFLQMWYEEKVVHGYGWAIIFGSLICSMFLWVIS